MAEAGLAGLGGVMARRESAGAFAEGGSLSLFATGAELEQVGARPSRDGDVP